MWQGLFHPDLPILNLTIRAIAVYVAVLLLLRISGKKQMGQLNATEFVAILLISNAVQNSMNGGDNSLVGGLWLATVLMILSGFLGYITYKIKFFSTIFEGTPTVLVHKGKIIWKSLNRERLRESELRALLRKQGVEHIHEIDSAIWESDGTLSITKVSDPLISQPK